MPRAGGGNTRLDRVSEQWHHWNQNCNYVAMPICPPPPPPHKHRSDLRQHPAGTPSLGWQLGRPAGRSQGGGLQSDSQTEPLNPCGYADAKQGHSFSQDESGPPPLPTGARRLHNKRARHGRNLPSNCWYQHMSNCCRQQARVIGHSDRELCPILAFGGQICTATNGFWPQGSRGAATYPASPALAAQTW
jgi:hypothetical protein